MTNNKNFSLSPHIVDYLKEHIGKSARIGIKVNRLEDKEVKLTYIDNKVIKITEYGKERTIPYQEMGETITLINGRIRRGKNTCNEWINSNWGYVDLIQEDKKFNEERDIIINGLEFLIKDHLNSDSFKNALPYLEQLKNPLKHYPAKLLKVNNTMSYITQYYEVEDSYNRKISKEFHEECHRGIVADCGPWNPEAQAEEVYARCALTEMEIQEEKEKHLASMKKLIMEYVKN